MGYGILMGSGGGSGASSSDTTAVAANVLTGKKYVGSDTNDGVGTGTMASVAGGTYNPTSSTRTIVSGGRYISSDIKVGGLTLPAAANLKKGYTYTPYSGLSVTGTLTKDYDLIKGSTALVTFTNTVRLQGSYCAIPIKTIAYSSSKINLADYKYLKFYCCNMQYFNNGDYFYGSTHMNSWKVGFGESVSTFKTSKSYNAYNICSIDISGYTGSYYILIQPNSSSPQSNAYGLVFDCYLTMS